MATGSKVTTPAAAPAGADSYAAGYAALTAIAERLRTASGAATVDSIMADAHAARALHRQLKARLDAVLRVLLAPEVTRTPRAPAAPRRPNATARVGLAATRSGPARIAGGPALSKLVPLFESCAWREVWQPGEEVHLYVISCTGLADLAAATGVPWPNPAPARWAAWTGGCATCAGKPMAATSGTRRATRRRRAGTVGRRSPSCSSRQRLRPARCGRRASR